MVINLILLVLLFLNVYMWGKEVLGKWWALLPAALTVISPHFVHESPFSALTFTVALFTFLNFLFYPSRFNVLLAGAAFGAAQISGPTAFILFFYYLLIIALFYSVGVVRDWHLNGQPTDHLHAVKVKGFRYARALVEIFVIGTLIFFLAQACHQFFLAKDTIGGALRTAYQAILSQAGFWQLTLPVSPFAALASEPMPVVALLLFSIAVGAFTVFRSARGLTFLQFVTTYFTQITLLLFIVLYLSFADTTSAITPFLFILFAQPVRNFITMKYDKELLIVIAHDAVHFSAKWLMLFSFLFWYALVALFAYL